MVMPRHLYLDEGPVLATSCNPGLICTYCFLSIYQISHFVNKQCLAMHWKSAVLEASALLK